MTIQEAMSLIITYCPDLRHLAIDTIRAAENNSPALIRRVSFVVGEALKDRHAPWSRTEAVQLTDLLLDHNAAVNISLRMNNDELAMIELAAETVGGGRSEFIRSAALREAARVLDE